LIARHLRGCPRISSKLGLDGRGLEWSSGGDAPWTPQTIVTRDASDAAQSGALTSFGGQSWLETALTGPGQVSFWWRVSANSSFVWIGNTNSGVGYYIYDYVRLTLDGVEQRFLSGEAAWHREAVAIPAGAHVLRWVYVKNSFNDGTGLGGLGCAWLDEVAFAPGALTLTHPSLAKGVFTVLVPTASGGRYWLEYNDTLSPGGWLALPVVIGEGGIQAIVDPGATNAQRFYRLMQQ